jgi:hypothetical protein
MKAYTGNVGSVPRIRHLGILEWSFQAHAPTALPP